MTDTDTCINPYGPESGAHTGPAQWVAVLYTQDNPEGVKRVGPLCLGHAEYERAWRDAWGMIAKARVEPAATSP